MTTQVENIHIQGNEHWTKKGDVKLFLWEKRRAQNSPDRGTILFVHGSSMASQPTFDLQVPGRPGAMDYFVGQGFDTWSVDMEGYGRSTKDRGIDATISEGADDLKAATDYIFKTRNHTGPLLVYGISSGALRAALFAQRHPNRVKRLALDAHVWTGEGSPTLVERRKKLPEFLKTKRRPIDRKFVRSIFERDHPGTADDNVIEAFADAYPRSSTTRSRTAPTSTCATTCRWSTRPRSWCRPSSCAANTTASRASRTC